MGLPFPSCTTQLLVYYYPNDTAASSAYSAASVLHSSPSRSLTYMKRVTDREFACGLNVPIRFMEGYLARDLFYRPIIELAASHMRVASSHIRI
jgi:hypothetical protein